MPKNHIFHQIETQPFTMVLVKGGTFMMGDDNGKYAREKPAHQVELEDFYMGQYPVTQGLWKAVMGAENNPSYYKGDDRPVEQINWEDCQKFITEINQIVRDETHSFRLPTEAEWEYAARGGINKDQFEYSGSNHLKEVGWYASTSHRETKDVGQLHPNSLGLYDMSGNVWEWCQDRYDEKYYLKCKRSGTLKNPIGPPKGSSRVLRGGGWFNHPVYCRVAYRGSSGPGGRANFIGFRLVWSSFSGSGASLDRKEGRGTKPKSWWARLLGK